MYRDKIERIKNSDGWRIYYLTNMRCTVGLQYKSKPQFYVNVISGKVIEPVKGEHTLARVLLQMKAQRFLNNQLQKIT
jgi:hypothetical protein